MPITLKDIADRAGFSVATVSRALAGYGDVNYRTRQQIEQIALELGYQPNLVARQLRNQRTDTIGIVTVFEEDDFYDDFFRQLLRGVSHAAARQGYDLLVSTTTHDQSELDTYRRIIGGNRVDGVVLARTYRDDPRIAYLQTSKHPFVVYGRSAPGASSDFPYIDVDSESGIRLATEHFLAAGHQHIGLILPPKKMAYTAYRLMGYQVALEAAGLPYRESYITYGDLRRGGGHTATQKLLDSYPDISALVVCNDMMALGAMAAIERRGLRVGADVAVSGYDDIPASEYANPPLTTVRHPIYEIGQRLIEMLIKIVQGIPLESSQVLLQPSLVVRASSGVEAESS